ncbi:Hypothetical protein FKW44_005776 [Caligus rogercresseyi]|uniref:Uncharacterized protein n=1 Tax=Caligus rogercresseyi TaxID=217165 RepID=A0A7T8QSA9_CALRO|nr:Hypothetical protein FKW44_005776 [Caligus rogercresseyi]
MVRVCKKLQISSRLWAIQMPLSTTSSSAQRGEPMPLEVTKSTLPLSWLA